MMLSPQNVPSLDSIPKFRFIGSKHNLLEYILGIIRQEKIVGETFFDVFCGSTAVSRYFKKMYSIISNDNLYFSFVLQKGLVTLNQYPSFTNIKDIVEVPPNPKMKIKKILHLLNRSEGLNGFIFNHYTPASKNIDGIERRYFSETNGNKIDGIRVRIEDWFNSKIINEDEYYYLLTSLLLAVQKVSNISGTYGAFNKIWDPRANKSLELRFIEVIPSNFIHKAFNKDSFELIGEINCDIAYIDPPYNSRQYISNYHVLETIAKYDKPKISGKTGIRKYTEKDKSVFCSNKTASDALLKLLDGLKTKTIILSYNSEGILSKEEITKIFENSKFKGVKTHEISYRRFKSNHKTRNDKIKEYLFIGKVIA